MDKMEYQAMADRLIADFRNKDNATKYLLPSDVAKHLLVGAGDAYDAINRMVVTEAMFTLRFTAIQLERALKAKLKEEVAQAKRDAAELKKQQRLDEAAARADIHSALAMEGFGADATDARDAVWKWCSHNMIAVRYDDLCTMNGQEQTPSAIEGKILLAAEKLGYTLGDGRIMTTGAIKLALIEYLAIHKDERKALTWEMIKGTDPATAKAVLRRFRELCEKMFREPAFADAAIRKFIWQVKRRMMGMYIEHLHFLILQGSQGSGKSRFCLELISPMHELSSEASIDELIDNKNFSLRQMFVGFCDELVKGDNTDTNKLKNLITGDYSTARVHYTHHSQRTKNNLSLLGTADKSVSSVLGETAGMRRYIEVVTKRKSERSLDWQTEVVQFPWPDLWAAVDHETIDPLMSAFGGQVYEKQETMRVKDTVEYWLDQFSQQPHYATRNTTHRDEYVEYGAQDLYTQSFVEYEMQFHRATRATSLTAWGTRFKNLIDNGNAAAWSYRTVSNLTFYRKAIGETVVNLRDPTGLTVVVQNTKTR